MHWLTNLRHTWLQLEVSMQAQYQGSKFRPLGQTRVEYTIYGEKVEKEIFIPTKGYLKWLDEQEKEKEAKEFIQLKEKLQYQQKTYGEVDEVDLLRFRQLLNKQPDVKGVAL